MVSQEKGLGQKAEDGVGVEAQDRIDRQTMSNTTSSMVPLKRLMLLCHSYMHGPCQSMQRYHSVRDFRFHSIT